MDLTQLNVSEEEISLLPSSKDFSNSLIRDKAELGIDNSVSLEAEIPEDLYNGINEFICSNPKWDLYRLMSSALASFLYTNGSEDRVVIEQYLNDLFALNGS